MDRGWGDEQETGGANVSLTDAPCGVSAMDWMARANKAEERLRYFNQLDFALRSISGAREGESTEAAMARVPAERTKEWSEIVFARDAEIATLEARVRELEAAPSAQYAARQIADRVIQIACDSLPADPDRDDTLCVKVESLRGWIAEEAESVIAPVAQPEPAASETPEQRMLRQTYGIETDAASAAAAYGATEPLSAGCQRHKDRQFCANVTHQKCQYCARCLSGGTPPDNHIPFGSPADPFADLDAAIGEVEKMIQCGHLYPAVSAIRAAFDRLRVGATAHETKTATLKAERTAMHAHALAVNNTLRDTITSLRANLAQANADNANLTGENGIRADNNRNLIARSVDLTAQRDAATKALRRIEDLAQLIRNLAKDGTE